MKLENSILICSYLDLYGSLLSKNQFEVCDAYFYADQTLSEIAENFSISRQAVLDTIKKCSKKLECYENKLQLFKKKSALNRLLDSFKNDKVSLNDFILEITKFEEEF
ncbi:MAG: DNA-binding protein [Clostridia bacterium]